MKLFNALFFFFLSVTCYSQNNYCVPSPTNGVNGHSINHFNLETLDAAFTGQPYQYFSAKFNHETCFLIPGKSYTIYMTSGSHAVSTLAAWIDWNNDATFSSSEKLGEVITTSANQVVSITFTVPSNSNTGKIWLRARSSNSTGITACTSYSSGETIDFSITILNPGYEYNFPNGWQNSGTGNYYIDGIVIDNIDNENTGGPSGPFYSDYSDQNAFITQCNPAYLYIYGNFSSSNDSVFLFFDYNLNGIFEDNELAGSTPVLSGNSIDSILINSLAVTGAFRMRIVLYSNSQMTEVEDYTINILSYNSSGSPSAQISSDLFYDCKGNCSFYGCKGSAKFYDYSCGIPTYRHWSVPGASPSSSLLQNPTFSFSNNGTYTITLIDSNSYGSDTISSQVIISAPLTVSLGSNTTICTGDSLLLSAPAGNSGDCYSYLWSTGETTRQIYVHVAGKYSVALSSCHHSDCTGYDTISVSFSPIKYNVSGGGSYCSGGTAPSVGLDDSENGISYRLYKNGTAIGTAINGTGSAISFGTQSAPGTYTVVATNTALSCTLSMSGNVSVSLNQLPVIYNVTGGGSVCSGGTGVAVGLNNSQSNASYQLYRNGISTGAPVTGTGSAIQFPNQNTAGTYTVTATANNSSCTASMSGSAVVVINPGPTIFNVTGAGNFCIGDSLPLAGLNDSETGVSYRVSKDGVPYGTSLPGTGNAISFGQLSGNGVFTVIATTISPSCNITMNGTIRISNHPVVYNTTGGGNICSGGTGLPVNLDHSELNVNYQLYRNGNAVGSPVSGTGNAITFPNNTITGNYTVVATANNSTCTSSMTGNANIVSVPVPVKYSVTGGGNFCSGSLRASLKLSDSDSGIFYELYKNGNPTGIITPGTDTSLSFPYLAESGTYTVIATTDTTTSACKATMTGSATFNLTPSPTAFVLTGGGTYCSGDSMDSMILHGSESWIRYQMYVDSLPIGNSLNGNGNPLYFGKPYVQGTYFIIGSSTLTSCYTTMNGSPHLEIFSKPPVFNVTGGGHYCNGSNGAPVILDNSSSSFTYQLYHNGVPLNTPVQGTGGPLNFGNQMQAGYYTVFASGTTATCNSLMNDTAFILIDPLPTPEITTVLPDSLCIFSSPVPLAGKPPGGYFDGDGILKDTLYPALAGAENVFIYYNYSDPVTHCSAYASGNIFIDLCIGIEEHELPSNITLFPNPADNKIISDFFLNHESDLSIELINDIGQSISIYNLNKVSGQFSFTINTSIFPDGFYIVKINLNKNVYTRKVIIHHS